MIERKRNIERIMELMQWDRPVFCDASSKGYLCWRNVNDSEIKFINERLGINCELTKKGRLIVPYYVKTKVYILTHTYNGETDKPKAFYNYYSARSEMQQNYEDSVNESADNVFECGISEHDAYIIYDDDDYEEWEVFEEYVS